MRTGRQLIYAGLAVCGLSTVFALPATTPRPLVIWHGMGDTYNADGIISFMDEIKAVHPGIFIHSIFVEEDGDKDKNAGFFGRIEDQLEVVREEVQAIPELAHGFDAIGFSQGGQFLRAYAQLYNSPPINNLITFGSQHMGVSDLPTCGAFDLLCKLMRSGAQRGVYTDWAQSRIVQAQYFRDPARYSAYLEHNVWLPYINNEIPEKRNQTYAANLASLSNLVLVVFTQDITVVPKETGWFGSYPIVADDSSPTEQDETPMIIPLREQPIYTEDWLGLKQLDEKGGLVMTTCYGVHMNVSRTCWEPLVKKYVGGTRSPWTSLLIQAD